MNCLGGAHKFRLGQNANDVVAEGVDQSQYEILGEKMEESKTNKYKVSSKVRAGLR